MAKLRFAVRQFGPFEQALQSCWQSYKESHNIAIDMEFVPMNLEQLYDALLVRDGLHNGEWDIVHINTDWIAKAYADKGLYVLNDFLDTQPVEAYNNAWSPSLLSFQNFDGEVVGLPFHDGPECLVVREDLFSSAIEQENFFKQYQRPLEVPRTWSDFLQVASFFTRPEQHLYGTIFAGYPDGHNAVFDFCIQLWSRGGELLDERGKIDLNQPMAIAALDFYRRLFKQESCLHPNSAVSESVKAGEAFANGEVAMMVNWFGFASWAQIDASSSVKGRVNIAPIPADLHVPSPSLNVYWLYAIAQGSKLKEQAYDFLRFAVGKEQDRLLTLAGGVGCRYSTWYDDTINANIPFYNKLGELHETARTLPRLSNWPDIAHIIDKTVSDAIVADAASSALLAEAQAKINKIQ